jgi:hypothetical protein
MEKVIFDYCLKLSVSQKERSSLDVSNLDNDELKGIANGKIFVFFEPKREYMVLETGIIDYLLQFKIVINEIDSGNYSPFSVSCDYYSNSLKYLYDNKTGKLKIIEVNGADFKITTNYEKFKSSFLKFYKNTMEELLLYYPELRDNKFFCSYLKYKNTK